MGKLAKADPGLDHCLIELWQLELNQIIRKEGDRVIFKAKVDWVEHGEQCTSYFLRASKANRGNSNIEKLMIEGEKVENKERVNDYIKGYVKKVYTKEEVVASQEWLTDLPRINQVDSEHMGRPVTAGEYHKAVFNSMNPGKSPGNDGLTVGLYKAL